MWEPPDAPNGLITNYSAFCSESKYERTCTPATLGDDGSGTEDVMAPAIFQNSTSNVTVRGNETSAVVDDLDPYTCYDCIVVAYTSVGEGSPSSFAYGLTDQSGTLLHDGV